MDSVNMPKMTYYPLSIIIYPLILPRQKKGKKIVCQNLCGFFIRFVDNFTKNGFRMAAAHYFLQNTNTPFYEELRLKANFAKLYYQFDFKKLEQ
jgi:hypothetical protein